MTAQEIGARQRRGSKGWESEWWHAEEAFTSVKGGSGMRVHARACVRDKPSWNPAEPSLSHAAYSQALSAPGISHLKSRGLPWITTGPQRPLSGCDACSVFFSHATEATHPLLFYWESRVAGLRGHRAGCELGLEVLEDELIDSQSHGERCPMSKMPKICQLCNHTTRPHVKSNSTKTFEPFYLWHTAKTGG